jgi:hypothetical protein
METKKVLRKRCSAAVSSALLSSSDNRRNAVIKDNGFMDV